MEFVKGTVAKSRAGHDKGDIQTVVKVDGKYAFVCDGKKRKLEKLKRKNIKHLEGTKNVLNECQLSSNSAIRKALSEYR